MSNTDAAFRFDNKMNFDFQRGVHTPNALSSYLAEIEQAHLIRASQEIEPAYWFKHALVQDAAYNSLMKQQRKRLHHLVAETLEQVLTETRDENAALLAHHFELAEDHVNALTYLQRAAEWAQRAAAHHEEVDLLTRALALAKETQSNDMLADLHMRRGKAFTNLTKFSEARTEFLAALELVPASDAAQRAQILNELALATQWLWDVATATQYAREALALAEQAGRDDLAAQAMCALAFAIVSDGDVRGGLEYYARAFEHAGKETTWTLAQSLEFSGLALYWISEYDQAAARIQDATARARERFDSFTVMRGLGNLGMALVGQGKYRQALVTFQAARAFGKEHDVKAFLSRALAMEAGLYLELYAYARAEHVALEARSVARAANFAPSATMAAIDLMINYARRGDFYLADQYTNQVVQVIPKTYGSHRWGFELRFAYARAELALARMQWESARELANDAIWQSRKYGRIKYEALGLAALAQAHEELKDSDAARAALHLALERARADGNPSLFLHTAIPLYRHEHTTLLLREIRATIQRIHAELPASSLRDGFDAAISEWI